MRTTVNLDDQLLEEAQRLTGISQRAALLRESLRALIERESARRLASLAGSEPQLRPVRRRNLRRLGPSRHVGLDRLSALRGTAPRVPVERKPSTGSPVLLGNSVGQPAQS